MRIGMQIVIAAALFACIVTSVGYVLLVQFNKSEQPTNEMDELIKNITQIILLGIFSFVIMACVMIFLIRSVTNPMRKLRDSADKIVKGDLDVKPYNKGINEVRDLADSFSTMVNKFMNLNDRYKNLYESS